MSLVVDCLKNFAMAQNRLYYEIQQEYEQLLQVPVLITAIGLTAYFRKKSLELGLYVAAYIHLNTIKRVLSVSFGNRGSAVIFSKET